MRPIRWLKRHPVSMLWFLPSLVVALLFYGWSIHVWQNQSEQRAHDARMALVHDCHLSRQRGIDNHEQVVKQLQLAARQENVLGTAIAVFADPIDPDPRLTAVSAAFADAHTARVDLQASVDAFVPRDCSIPTP